MPSYEAAHSLRASAFDIQRWWSWQKKKKKSQQQRAHPTHFPAPLKNKCPPHMSNTAMISRSRGLSYNKIYSTTTTTTSSFWGRFAAFDIVSGYGDYASPTRA